MEQKFEPQELVTQKVSDLRAVLLQNREALNQLEPKESKDLIIQMILNCPKKDWVEFGNQIFMDVSLEEGESNSEYEEDFIADLNRAYEVQQTMINLLLDPYPTLRQSQQTEYFTEGGYDDFNEYATLVIIALDNKGPELVQKLVESTPVSERSKVSNIIKLLFVDLPLPQQLRAAFESTEETTIQNEDNTTTSEEPAKDLVSPKSVTLELDGKTYEHIEVYTNPLASDKTNGFFAQSESRKRAALKPEADTNKFDLLPRKLSLSMTIEGDDDNKNCCERFCTIY